MSNVIFVLGAGASKQAGAPLMADFLDTAAGLLERENLGDAKAAFETVFRARSALQRVHSKSNIDLDNVESVFAAFEMAKILRRLADWAAAEIDGLAEAMKRVIVVTLERTLIFGLEGSQLRDPPPYAEFANLIRQLTTRAEPRRSTAIITFNYDIGADFALTRSGLRINYGLEESTDAQAIPLLKLHGSLNWGRCPSCNKVVPVAPHDYLTNTRPEVWPETKGVRFPVGTHLPLFKHCDYMLPADSVIVPPTWNKLAYQDPLAPVWARAASELREAESIFIIGYSLPETDQFFRHFYALGSEGEVTLKRFWVFNPDTTEVVNRRFLDLLGIGAARRYRYFKISFAEAIKAIADEFAS